MRVGWTEILLILAVVVILFGGRRIPELMRGIGEGIRGLKEGMQAPEKPAGSNPASEEKK